MYLRHFAFTRMPFETPAETDERFESNARREAEARLGHLIELKLVFYSLTGLFESRFNQDSMI